MDLRDPRFLFVAACMLAGLSAEATVGFGSVVITLALASAVLPVDVLLPVIVPPGLSLSLYIVARHHAHADRALILRRILPSMALGMAAGFAIFDRAPRELLQRLFGGFVTALALFELAMLRTHSRRNVSGAGAGRHRAVEGVAMLGAGVCHGLFSSGGPLLVWSLEHAGLTKSSFRSTLAIVWVVLGSALNLAYLLSGRIDRTSLLASAALLPVVAIAIVLGEWLHHRLDDAWFKRAVFTLLLVAGLANLL